MIQNGMVNAPYTGESKIEVAAARYASSSS